MWGEPGVWTRTGWTLSCLSSTAKSCGEEEEEGEDEGGEEEGGNEDPAAALNVCTGDVADLLPTHRLVASPS